MFARILEDDAGRFFARLPHAEAAWQWKHASEQFRQLASRKGILDELEESEGSLSETRKALVEEKAWLGIQERLAARPELTQALRDYSALQQSVPKTRTAKSYLPNLRAAQRALTKCSDAVPVWVMAIDEVAEMFAGRATGSEPAFDVAIVDEASQSPITSAFVMQLASSVAIVGDPYQTSPPLFMQYAALTAARSAISDLTVRARLAPAASLWNIGAVVVDKISLTEHFRCPPEVIGWAQEKIYRHLADVDLEVLTGTNPHRPKPIIAHHVAGGFGEKTNPNEAAALVTDLRHLLEDPPSWLHTVGVVARTPEQAGIIQRLVFDSIDETTLESVDIRVGTPYQFQGTQRDVMYLSMVGGPPENGGMRTLRSFDTVTVNQINVAVSRAKQQLRVFYSCPPSGYKPDDVRRSFLEHAIAADRDWELRKAPGVPLEIPEDVRVDPFDSLSEQRLFNRLVRRGFAVTPQVEAPVGSGRYRLDFVVDGPVGSVAVEYDGPHHDTAHQYLYDRERTHDLARCGWTVLRVHHTDFNVDRDATAEALAQELRSRGVLPIGEWEQRFAEPPPEPPTEADPPAHSDPPSGPGPDLHFAASGISREPTLEPSHEEADPDLVMAAIEATRSMAEDLDEFDVPRWEPVDDEEEIEVRSPIMPMVPVSPAPMPVVFEPPLEAGGLLPYLEFEGSVADPMIGTRPELVDGLIEVVATEGPILGDRLIQVYNRAAGNRRTGRNIRSALNSALTSAERQGRLIADNPLQLAGNKDKTYRLPDQPQVIERTAGPRTLNEIPPLELLARIERASKLSNDRETANRAVLADYGFKRLTPGVTEVLDCVWRLRG